jgi:release factor glutamine methyltransferase
MTETEVLFTEILDCNKVDLYLNRGDALTAEESARIQSAFLRRITGEPLQYILSKAEFMGLEFKVSSDVFIPRPETEILVEKAIEVGNNLSAISDRLKILDVGTGSGCIAVSLAKFLPKARITATDISLKALEIAKENAQLNNVSINFIPSDLFVTYELQATSYELIVSNPPYISTNEIASLQPELQYEPRTALDGGKDGLDFYRRIIQQAPNYLKENGVLIMELGFGQAEAVKNIIKESNNLHIIDIVSDYNDIERVIMLRGY